MRCLALLMLLAGVARADGMPAGTWHVLRVDAGPPHCETWVATATSLAIGASSIDLSSDGARVYLGSSSGRTCDNVWSVHERDDGLDVDGAVWFRDARACKAALARHARVAMDAPGCIAPAPPPAPATTRARFERVMARGGALYGEACRATAVHVDRQTARSAQGRLVSVREDDHARETISRPYDLTYGSDHIVTLPPSIESIPRHRGPCESGGTYACICADDHALVFGDEWVELLGERYYLSLAGCRKSAERARTLASWHSTT